MKRYFFLIALSLFAVAVIAQSKMSPMTQIFLQQKSDNLVDTLDANSPFPCSVTSDGVEMVSAFVHFHNAVNLGLLDFYGVRVNNVYDKLNVVSAEIPSSQLAMLADEPEVKYVEMAIVVYPRMDQARAMSRVNPVHEAHAPLPQTYTGKGVYVGIVDHGFQYTHPAFYNSDYSKCRIVSVWEQTAYGSSSSQPAGFSYGKEYATASAIKTRAFDDKTRDDVGHGCHVAGVAAGARYGNCPYYGVAYESDLVFVSYDYYSQRNSVTTDAVDYVFRKATEAGKPAVVNLSLGTHIGPHDGTSTVDRIFDTLAGEGRIIVGACGNEQGDKFHVSRTFSDEETELKSMFNYAAPLYSGVVDVWIDSICDASFQLAVYDRTNKNLFWETIPVSAEQLRAGVNDSETISISVKNDGTINLRGSVSYSSSVNPFNGKTHLTLHVRFENKYYGYFPGFIFKGTKGTVHAWTDDVNLTLTNNNIATWDDGNNISSVGEIGGTSKSIIACGAYNSRARNMNGKVGALASFSSLGPTADGRVKPEIVGPGSYVVSSVPNTTAVKNGRSYDFAQEVKVGSETFLYSHMQGTSMSAPFVTGVIATWLQANPKLTRDQILEAFEHSAIRDEFTGDDLPNNLWGYGKIDAQNGLLYILGLPTSVENPEMPASMMAYPNPAVEEVNIGFVKNDNNVRIIVYSLGGQVLMEEHAGVVTRGESHKISLGNLENGAYIVRVQGDLHNETFKLMVRR